METIGRPGRGKIEAALELWANPLLGPAPLPRESATQRAMRAASHAPLATGNNSPKLLMRDPRNAQTDSLTSHFTGLEGEEVRFKGTDSLPSTLQLHFRRVASTLDGTEDNFETTFLSGR